MAISKLPEIAEMTISRESRSAESPLWASHHAITVSTNHARPNRRRHRAYTDKHGKN